MSLLSKGAVTFALLLLASIVFTRFYLSDGNGHGVNYSESQPYSSPSPTEPVTEVQYPEIPAETGSLSTPVVTPTPAQPITISATEETDLSQDQQFRELLAEAYSSESRIRLYSFLDSAPAQNTLFSGRNLSASDAELLWPLLRTTFVETDSRIERIRAHLTLKRFIKYQLEEEPWQYVFDEWPEQHLTITEIIDDILHVAIEINSRVPDADSLDTAREVALTQFEKDPRWSVPARVLIEINAIASGLESEESYSTACTILTDADSIERCQFFVSNLRKHL